MVGLNKEEKKNRDREKDSKKGFESLSCKLAVLHYIKSNKITIKINTTSTRPNQLLLEEEKDVREIYPATSDYNM